MAIRNIVKEGDPILNKVCRPVTNFDDRLATLLDDMRETMIDADGVGLAGPQVGMLRRVFVVWDTTDAPEEIPENYEYKFIDFVNPEILAGSAHRTGTASGSSWKPRACWPAASSTRTTIWTASPSCSPASISMRTPKRAKRLPAKRKETSNAHSVHGHTGHCRRVPEGSVCRRA